MRWLENPNYFEYILNLSLKKRSAKTINIIVDTVLYFYDFLAKKGVANNLNVYTKKASYSEYKPFLYEILYEKKLVNKSLLKKKVQTNSSIVEIEDEIYQNFFNGNKKTLNML